MAHGSVPKPDMSNQSVLPPNKVSSAYESLLEAFRATVEDANLTISIPRPVRSCFLQTGDVGTAAFKECLYLKGWPCRRLPGSKRLDIVINALETFARPSWSLMKSTVYLNYFVVSDSTAELVQALHYDFVQGGQPDHPFFHVQLSDEAIPDADLKSTGFDLEVQLPERSSQCWVTTRIPTAEMTLASVLYSLVADHLGEGSFGQFANDVHAIQERLPSPNFDAMKKSFQKSATHFKSSHWFAHMLDATQANA
jgi:hypothetical protein